MKVLLLADAESIHTKKWVVSLKEMNIDVAVFSLRDSLDEIYSKGIWLYSCDIDNSIFQKGSLLKKLCKYILCVFRLKKVVNEFRPDVIHAHYASSYGLLGALLNYHPFVISVWGSDIYDFPNKTIFNKYIIKYNFMCANQILSTSYAMVREIKKYTKKGIKVIPFGVDTNNFKVKKINSIFSNSDFVFGSIKSLEKIYGVDNVIRAFAKVYMKYPNLKLNLLIVGDGCEKGNLEELSRKLGVNKATKFIGKVNHSDISRYLNMMSISMVLSHSESFGVSVLEASACEKPVIATDVGGLPEVVNNNETGIIVADNNIDETVKAMCFFVDNPDKISQMGERGRKFVKKHYRWEQSVSEVLKVYCYVLERCKKIALHGAGR